MAEHTPLWREPLFRWPGSKWHLVPAWAPRLRAHLDATGGRLVSLFFGSGALEQVDPQHAVAADANPDLRALYSELQRDAGAEAYGHLHVFDRCFARSRTGYAVLRAAGAESLEPAARAARFLWLSGLAWNGLWRVNRAGQLNVPADPGRLMRPWPFPHAHDLAAAAARLPRQPFLADWRAALQLARPGDLVLADPPYIGGFDAYCASGFPLAEQHQLAAALARAAGQGVAVVAFNSPAAHSLYRPWASISRVQRSGRINSRAQQRGPVDELLATCGLRSANEREAA